MYRLHCFAQSGNSFKLKRVQAIEGYASPCEVMPWERIAPKR